MPAINQLLLPDEKIAFITRKHMIIFLGPFVWTSIAIFLLWLETHSLPGLSGFSLLSTIVNLRFFTRIAAIVALLSWLNQAIIYMTSIFLVTGGRLIMREGFLFLHATETNLSAIAEVKIDQSIMGRLLGFGNITINSFGGGGEVFTTIASPYQFQRAVSEKRRQAF